MDSDSELQIASADLAFNQSTDPGPGDSVIFSDYLPRSLVRILDLGYTLESPSELIKRGLGVSQKPPGDHRAQLGWRWRCCHLPRLHRSHPRCPSCWPSFITGGGHGLGSSVHWTLPLPLSWADEHLGASQQGFQFLHVLISKDILFYSVPLQTRWCECSTLTLLQLCQHRLLFRPVQEPSAFFTLLFNPSWHW